jgi:hypothetical protein
MLGISDRREASALLVQTTHGAQAGLPQGIDERTAAAAG